MFPRNAWYVAAMPDEIAADKPLGRRICGEPMALYRDEHGLVAAVEDFCPHRGAPLSLGFVQSGKLVCGYHGLAMGRDGRTCSMPCQRVRGFPAIKAYPVAERYGFVWVWPGDPAQAREQDIPVPIWWDKPDWAYGGGLYHMKCDFRLLVDNLMDLTHETYVHSTSIGQKEIDEAPVATRMEEGVVVTERYMEKIYAPPFWRMAMQANDLDPDAQVDRWQICRFVPPSNVLIDVGVALQGHGGFHAPDDKKVHSVVVDYITPETETSCWYFWGMARHFKADDAALTDTIRTGQGKIFAEDLEMLERQQANLLHWPQRQLLKLNIDTGGVMARKIVDQLLAAERPGVGAPA
ncbi:aromatic ring-hydroxylating dioxygenase subunit alpha [Ideonella livida]|uniref:Aromatic ring-hydroxylating dioxygenase subunit alpha n=1 Tax=Ideonella livida TaxID=2707176 RepID=A0A7C9PGD4_9BURK|nr:aromatic ring-hydroxylating dioxygenase subunit alpha [Ideonella livida]NDY91277.1 aromatic ring-hydroxylating dioxygenase subunit alpha [Ideonella livida]